MGAGAPLADAGITACAGEPCTGLAGVTLPIEGPTLATEGMEGLSTGDRTRLAW